MGYCVGLMFGWDIVLGGCLDEILSKGNVWMGLSLGDIWMDTVL